MLTQAVNSRWLQQSAQRRQWKIFLNSLITMLIIYKCNKGVTVWSIYQTAVETIGTCRSQCACSNLLPHESTPSSFSTAFWSSLWWSAESELESSSTIEEINGNKGAKGHPLCGSVLDIKTVSTGNTTNPYHQWKRYHPSDHYIY